MVFVFIQIHKLTIKVYSHRRYINIQYYLILPKPIMRRHFFRKLSQNYECIQTHCNDRRKPFHFAYRNWYFYSNPQY